MYFFAVYKNYWIAYRYYLKASQTQLPYHLVWKDKKRIKLNLPKLDNAKFLFSKLLYLNNIEDPNFQSFITDVINGREDLQKFLLGSSVISDSIQEEINLAVLNTKLNDPTYLHKGVLRKPNPYEVLIQDISRFNVQNPIMGTLLKEAEGTRPTDSNVRNFPGKAPDIKDTEL